MGAPPTNALVTAPLSIGADVYCRSSRILHCSLPLLHVLIQPSHHIHPLGLKHS